MGALLVGLWFSVPVNAQSSDSTFTVDSTADVADAVGDGICATASGACTLRAAIIEANGHPGPDTIKFNIAGNGVHTIQLASELPKLNDRSGPTTIDGYTQSGSSPNTNSRASNAVIKVEIKGNGHDSPEAGGFTGLVVRSPENVVRGLAFYSLNRAIYMYGSDAHDNYISGNFVGTDAAGAYSAPRQVISSYGIVVSDGATSNTIGGVSPAERNVISGNAFHSVAFFHPGTDSNVVAGNLIGLDPTGSKRLSNLGHGIDINSGASYNVIGGDSTEERNVISGNTTNGIEVSHPEGADPSKPVPTGNRVIGNFIGTDITGELGPGYSYNGSRGVFLEDGPKSTVIRENVIGNNRDNGILIANSNTTDNRAYNNRIGVSRRGAAIPNGRNSEDAGVAIEKGAKGSQIGPGNIIAYNTTGVRLSESESSSNTITSNSIYNNVGLGIDLEPLGTVNENDAGDADTGVNELQNSPRITSARVITRTTKRKKRKKTVIVGTAIAGTLNSAPNQTFTLELFSSSAEDTNEGKTLLTETSVSTDASGNGSFDFEFPYSSAPLGSNITATATDAEGNTSEFSLNRPVSR